jgi:ERCC4-type nuclease
MIDFAKATILVDTREQLPLEISACQTATATLPTGDYGLAGLSGESDAADRLVIWERKSLPDLIGSLTSGHERFYREIERMAEFNYAVLMVEAVEDQIRMGEFRSGVNVAAVLGMIERIRQNGIHVVYCADRRGMVEFIERSARLVLRAREKAMRVGKRIKKGLDKSPEA